MKSPTSLLLVLSAAALLPACTTVSVDPRAAQGNYGSSGNSCSPRSQPIYVINNSPGANSRTTTTNTTTNTRTQRVQYVDSVGSFSGAGESSTSSTSSTFSPYDASRYDTYIPQYAR